MPPSPIWVLKLGGAMHHAAELPAWLAACAGDGARATRCVVVAGGGALADEVRALQTRWCFDDGLAHELALETMRLNARLLLALAAQLTPSSAVSIEQMSDAPAGDLLWSPPPNFAPVALPRDWTVSSDSIALWLAQVLGASAVILVKSLSEQALQPDSAVHLAAQGVVDAHFPQQLAHGRVAAYLLSKTMHQGFAEHLRSGTPLGARIR